MMAFFAVQDDFADKSAHTSASTACAVAAIGATVGESFITFQVSGYNTYGGSINAAGVVDGSYVDLHGSRVRARRRRDDYQLRSERID